MELVLDANILVAGFLRAATTRELLVDERLTLWAPAYSLTEVERVLTSPRLRRRLGGLSAVDIRAIVTTLTGRLHVVPASTYRHHLPTARQLATHAEDAPYVALALHLHLPLWSNDAELKMQRQVPIYTTQELLDLLAR